jgi:hypothetical protein
MEGNEMSTDIDGSQDDARPRGLMGGLGRVYVPPDCVGIVKRKFGSADPKFPRVGSGDHRGWQAATLPPGQVCWRSPALYSVELVPRIRVPADMIGLVTAREGARRPRGQKLGKSVECDDFQDGQAFLLNGGEQGRQTATLAGDQSYYINTRLFDVEFVPRTYVPVGTIGLVVARGGKVMDSDRRFARHVDCDSFQDAWAFLEGGGEQGRQLDVLPGGTFYDIHPDVFSVVTVDNVAKSGLEGLTAAHLTEFAIPTGEVGVVTTLDGAPSLGAGTVGPRVEGHRGYRLPWVFLEGGGLKGVQEQTLSEGSTCALNPWFARVVLVPTHVLILNWSETPAQKAGNYDAQLARITVTVQGHPVHLELSQTLQIPEKTAPKLVSAFGADAGNAALGGLVNDRAPVQRFVEKVLGATVNGYLNGIAASTSVQEFLGRYNEARRHLADNVNAELRKWNVEPRNTNLGSFSAKDERLNTALQAVAYATAESETLDVQIGNAEKQATIAVSLMKSKLMEADPQLWSEVEALGEDNVTLLRTIASISGMNVPEFISTNGGSGLGDILPATIVRDLVRRLSRGGASDSPMLDPAKVPPAAAEGEAAQTLPS